MPIQMKSSKGYSEGRPIEGGFSVASARRRAAAESFSGVPVLILPTGHVLFARWEAPGWPTGALLALQCWMNAPLVTAAPPGLTPAPDLVGSGEERISATRRGPGVAITFLGRFTPKERPSFRPPRRRKPTKEIIYSSSTKVIPLSAD